MMNSSWPIYVTGPDQIVFHLKAPFRWFLGTMVGFDGLIFDSQYVIKHGGFGTPASFNTYFNQNPIPGTGPYVVTGVSVNSFVKFSQNPTYWGRSLSSLEIAAQPMFDPGHVKNVIMYSKADDVVRYTDLSTGAAQIAAITTSDWSLVLANQDKFSYLTLPPWAGLTVSLSLNAAQYPTNITDVRLAIVHAINYTDIAQKVFFGKTAPLFGPEYPAWSDFYNLGNYSQYSYNVTLAKQYLATANLRNLPPLTFRIYSGCQWCSTLAQIVQSDLSDIGLSINIVVVQSSLYFSVYGSYSSNVQNADQIGQLSLLGGTTWAPAALTPADYWLSFVSNRSLYGNWAVYYHPTVQACADSFTSSIDVTYIQSLCKQAQAQIYNDAPYAWLGVARLWYAGGSLVWQKSMIKSFYVEQLWAGESTAPLFNTIVLNSS
jgi:ABC-type transport system substrate-binding protein